MSNIVHGKAGTYTNRKCRCAECTKAWNLYCQRYKNEPRPEKILPEHGTLTRYWRKCRCVECRKAYSIFSGEVIKLRRENKYADMVKKYGNQCNICGKSSDRKLAMDHIHGTNIIRGLLCTSCNTGLGKLGDNEEGLRRALDYVIKRTPSH